MIIDAENLILGRMATVIAKQALQGEKIDVINVEKAVVTGKREEILARYNQKFDRGHAKDGPFFPRHPEKIVKRSIRGMIPYKQGKGKEAFKNIKCYIGIPKELEGKKAETIEKANVKNIKKTKHLTIKEISQQLGWRE
ncbi:MAG: 50S ribosomal protein L13 [Nanoarchaeota archaeon]|nr:50S ribosomal protein L13 [Nanoarchaeota archaeon]MCG2717356.1 50S ribosomal protein L13 [Nanoarchaeota archaeon]